MRARRGRIVTPTPAATSAWAAIVSSASKATRGSKPASRQARSVIWRQPQRPVARDPGLVGQVGQLAAAPPGEPVALGRARRRSVSSTRCVSSRSVAERPGHRLEVVDQREVDVARAQALAGLLGLGLDHAQLHLAGGGRGTRPRRAAPAWRRRSGSRPAAGGRRAGPARAASSSSASSMRARIASVWATSARPASVSRTPREPRSTSVAPGLTLQRRHVLADGRLGEARAPRPPRRTSPAPPPPGGPSCGARRALAELIARP